MLSVQELVSLDEDYMAIQNDVQQRRPQRNKAETRVMQLQAKECQGMLASTRNQEDVSEESLQIWKKRIFDHMFPAAWTVQE